MKLVDGVLKSDEFWLMAYVAVVTYVTSLVLFTLLFLLTPLLVQSSNTLLLGVAAVSYRMVSLFYMCHQLPERSFFLWGMQFPICSRCMGIYLGGSLGGFLALAGFLKMPRFFRTRKMLLLMALPMVLDGVTQTFLYARESDNALRLVTGLMFGFGILYFVTSRVAGRNTVDRQASDAWKIALAVNAVVLLTILAAGLFTGPSHMSKDDALAMAAGFDKTVKAEYVVYYVPHNALRNIRSDPYLGSYDDVVLRELARTDYRKHDYGLWVVALLDERRLMYGRSVYAGEASGTYLYIDATSRKIDKAVEFKRKTEEVAVVEGGFTVIVLPDTQYYSESYPHVFENQTRWIAGNVGVMKIAFVAHVGDIVNNYNDENQWVNANKSMSMLDGKVPYGILPGNHDGPGDNYDTYFPSGRFESYGWYGGGYSGNRYSYQTFKALGGDYVVVNLEYCPTADGIAWANNVLSTNGDKKAIVVTHSHLDPHGGRRPHGCETQYIWDDLIAPNSNVFLVLSGHVHAESRRTDIVNGRRVHQLMADYQDEPNGGDGWLRILEFYPDEGRIRVRTYSPYLQEYQHDSDSEFTLDLNVTA